MCPGRLSAPTLACLFGLAVLTGPCAASKPPAACGSSGETAQGYLSGTQNVTLSVDQRDGRKVQRTFVLFVPFGDVSETCMSPGPPSSPRPLVVNWHGCNRHLPVVDYHLDISRMNERAADFLWYTIHPVGTTASDPGTTTTEAYGWNAEGCCAGCHDPLIDDVAFAEAILDWAQQHLCVDMDHVFSTGFSNGAFMSYTLACSIGHRLAGVAANAGSISRSKVAACSSPALGPLPVVSFHSLADTYVPYNGTLIDASQPDVDAMFRLRAGCNGSEAPVVTFNSTTTTCLRTTCTDAAGTATPVESCALKALNHCWIGGRTGGFNKQGDCRRRPGDVDATLRMFEFWSEATNVVNPSWL